MLHVVCFKWASPGYRASYTAEHVNILEGMARRHYRGDLRFVCITDDLAGIDGETHPLWPDCGDLMNGTSRDLPSCYRRLKLFDPSTQQALGVEPGDRIVSLDLDTVIVGGLNAVWDFDDPFIGWALRGTYHPRVFNGSMWMLRAGEEAHVWQDFDPRRSPQEAKAARFMGSDQAWLSYRLQGRAGWTEADGVYSFPMRLRNTGWLPENARVVMFHGPKKPWHNRMPAWVREHYRRTERIAA